MEIAIFVDLKTLNPKTNFLPLIDSETPQLIIPLHPLGQIGSDRRQLIVTVIDLETGCELISEQAIAELH